MRTLRLHMMLQHVMTTWYNMSLTSISSTFQLSKRPLLAVEFVAPLARIDPIYKEEEEAFKVSDKSPRVRIASRCGKTWSYSILVPSLCSHHKRENTDVSTCEKLKFVWWYWQGQNLYNFGAAYFASLGFSWALVYSHISDHTLRLNDRATYNNMYKYR